VFVIGFIPAETFKALIVLARRTIGIFTQVKQLLTLAIGSLLLLGCFGSKSNEEDQGEPLDSALIIPREDLMSVNELNSSTGKKWTVTQTPMLDSGLVNVRIEVNGLTTGELSVDFGEVDPVLSVSLDDLDHDGFQEVYVLTQSAPPLAFGSIVALASIGDSTVSVISLEGPTPYTMKGGEVYDGYRGGDVFTFKEGKLTNTFPVYRPDDPEGNPSGGSRTVTYQLTRGVSGFRLTPVNEP
jgi:hypothetical protein